MLYHIIIWNVLLVVCLTVGTGVLNSLRANYFDRTGDRLIAATWLGLITLSLLLLATGIFVPLSPITGIAVFLCLIVIALLSSVTRAELRCLCQKRYFLTTCIVIVCSECVVAAFITQPIYWFDTGLYHLGAIRWFEQYGTVPGLALLNDGFGFTSAWFALAAPFLPEVLGSHIGAVTNGFIFACAVWQLLVLIFQLCHNTRCISDWFLSIALSLLIAAYTVTVFTGSPILISFSPDVPVALIINILAWSLLVASAGVNSTRNSLITKPQNPYEWGYLIPTVLAVGAISNKLSGLPLFPLAALFYVCSVKLSFKKILISSVLILILWTPLTSTSILTSGCFLFPSTTVCLEVPWKVSKAKADAHVQVIRGIHKNTPQRPSLLRFVERQLERLRWNRKRQLMVLTFSLGVAAIAFYIITKVLGIYKYPLGTSWVLGLGVLGTSFILLTAPLIRFGLGYFIVVPAIICAVALDGLTRLRGKSSQPRHREIAKSFPAKQLNISLRIFSISVASLVITVSTYRADDFHWFLPPKVPGLPPLETIYINDVKYTYPSDWSVRCWDAELPCTPTPVSYEIRLRKPSLGIAGGFIRADDI